MGKTGECACNLKKILKFAGVPGCGVSPGGRREPACKPGSVVDGHSSGTHVAVRLERPTRGPCGPQVAASAARPLLGLAPGGVCPATAVASGAVRSYRTFSPLPAAEAAWAVYFLWHFPWARAPQALPGTLSCGARTFLRRLREDATAAIRPTPGDDDTDDRRRRQDRPRAPRGGVEKRPRRSIFKEDKT